MHASALVAAPLIRPQWWHLPIRVHPQLKFGVQAQGCNSALRPDLLDWLASEFVAGGWGLKKLHRLMVASEAYRQASAYEGVRV